MTSARGLAAHDATSPLKPWTFERRDLRPDDVAIDILYCGVCHSDLHQARNDWGNTVYPCVPGHEIVGRVTAVGPEVTRFKVGQHVAVGTLVDSCMACDRCGAGEQQQCRKRATGTYNSKDRVTGDITLGGYATAIVAREAFVLAVPDGLDLARVGPILCAGITTYAPLKVWGAGPGVRVAVAGLGGLGHMAVKLAAGLGAQVTVVTGSPDKAKDARDLGAHAVINAKVKDEMRAGAYGFDLVIDTIPVAHDLMPYTRLLDVDGTLVIVGAVDFMPPIHTAFILADRKRIAGSATGGLALTQELLEFCAVKNILPDCEIVPARAINDAFARMERGDVKYRFVLDMKGLGET